MTLMQLALAIICAACMLAIMACRSSVASTEGMAGRTGDDPGHSQQATGGFASNAGHVTNSDSHTYFDLGELGLFRTANVIWDTSETFVMWRDASGQWQQVRGGNRYHPLYLYADGDAVVIIENRFSPHGPIYESRFHWHDGTLQHFPDQDRKVSMKYLMELIHGPLPEGIEEYTIEAEVEELP